MQLILSKKKILLVYSYQPDQRSKKPDQKYAH
jgi:hypothetical protein